MSDERTVTGGCMCGAVRYEAGGEPFQVALCHCESCRRHNGAPVAALAGYLAGQVRFEGEERGLYASSPGVGRGFCRKCGTPLTWEGDGGEELGMIVELHLSTLDDPEALVPTGHAFYPERISWFDVADSLPRYEGYSEMSTLLRHGPE